MLSRLKNFLIGSPLPTYQLAEKRLNKVRALAAFSPDALSSIAYANQEIPFDSVVREVAPERLPERWPLFQAMFQLRNLPPTDPEELEELIRKNLNPIHFAVNW